MGVGGIGGVGEADSEQATAPCPTLPTYLVSHVYPMPQHSSLGRDGVPAACCTACRLWVGVYSGAYYRPCLPSGTLMTVEWSVGREVSACSAAVCCMPACLHPRDIPMPGLWEVIMPVCCLPPCLMPCSCPGIGGVEAGVCCEHGRWALHLLYLCIDVR